MSGALRFLLAGAVLAATILTLVPIVAHDAPQHKKEVFLRQKEVDLTDVAMDRIRKKMPLDAPDDAFLKERHFRDLRRRAKDMVHMRMYEEAKIYLEWMKAQGVGGKDVEALLVQIEQIRAKTEPR